jgi:competence protein ComEC
VDNGQKFDSATFGDLETLRVDLTKHGKLNYVDGKENSGEDVKFCPDVKMRLLEPWSADESLSDPNDRSVAVHLKFKDTSFLFMGDIEGRAEEVLVNHMPNEQKLLDVDVLKVGHHGSDTSTTADFLNAVSPRMAVISCGKKDVGTNDGYKHPRVEPLNAINNKFKDNDDHDKIDAYDGTKKKWLRLMRKEDIWVTTADGEITITSDGQKLDVAHTK